MMHDGGDGGGDDDYMYEIFICGNSNFSTVMVVVFTQIGSITCL